PEGGGDATAIANMEYRFPLSVIPIKGLGAAFFYDVGNVFLKASDISMQNFTHTAGTGLRYQTPVGPVRFDIGMKIHAPNDPKAQIDDRRFHFFFTLGHTF